jgi:hypothetical protein
LQIIIYTVSFFKAKGGILYLRTLFISYVTLWLPHFTFSFTPFTGPELCAHSLGLFSTRNLIHPTHPFFFLTHISALEFFSATFPIFTCPAEYGMAAVFRIEVATILANAFSLTGYTCAKVARGTIANAYSTRLTLYCEWV